MSDYIKEFQVHLQESYTKAKERCDKAQAKQKDQFDKKARATELDIGDKVLVKNLAIEGKKKLSNFYEEGTSSVVQQINQNIPLYIVRSEDQGRSLGKILRGGGGRGRWHGKLLYTYMYV